MNNIIPKSCDVTGGIPQRSLKEYGNAAYEDCDVAAYYHVEMFKNIAKGSSFKKLLWKIGFHCPTNADAIKDYTDYLFQRLHITPAQDSYGISITDFLDWQKSRGVVVGWALVDTSDPTTSEQNVRQAMFDFRGVILSGAMTYNSLYYLPAEWVTGTTPHDQPQPNVGHAVAMCQYTNTFDECISWGARQRMSIDFRVQIFPTAVVFLLASEKNDPGFAEKLALMNSWAGGGHV